MKIFPSVASDLYGKLTYDDVDCQKKIICEFMDEPEMFGEQPVPKTSAHLLRPGVWCYHIRNCSISIMITVITVITAIITV